MAATIRKGVPEDCPSICRKLERAGLPVDDLRPTDMRDFLVAHNDRGQRIAAIGLQRFGSPGLLRSLIVEETARGAGLGRRLVGALEQTAIAAGIVELWLLTIDAERFFANLGYAVVDRAEAPDAIRDSAEFSALCPGTAYLMQKAIV